ncbi:hypothetical protein B0J12DRAFT_282553 [Macrophomina phaseolina]|uniref:Proteolipid membrane potential modulator n=1 Tax=Macrophomina phaseolina TaxID=35725 RepID=A0ABQ8GN08_9PEZI|nr:hypothetical protein B0J12DRAFT_282553 [Macrophomina phaseolina]
MAICYRIFITLANIFFPPLAVIFLTGFGTDTLINALLFLAAIIPSHIHGFYLSCTYFHRRRKVRKGRYPGGPKPLIYSENVIFGGARWDEVQTLRRKEEGGYTSTNTTAIIHDGTTGDEKRKRRTSRRESRRVNRRPAAYGGGVGKGSYHSMGSGTGGTGGGGYAGLRYGLGDGDAAGWNASNGVVGPGYGSGYRPSGGAYRGTLRRTRTAY